jgi:hypothetical protein
MVLIKDYDWSTQKASTASDRTRDGRHRQRGTQISPLKLVAILMDSSLPIAQWNQLQK